MINWSNIAAVVIAAAAAVVQPYECSELKAKGVRHPGAGAGDYEWLNYAGQDGRMGNE